MWQLESEATKNSSGLYLVLSPRNAGSEEAGISSLFSAQIW
jgi:hypothetical protein